MIALAAIVAGLKTQLATIDGLHIDDFIPGSVNLPAVIVLPPTIDYVQTFSRGLMQLDLEVAVLVSAALDRQQKDLFGYLDWSGAQSIVAAVDADKTLGLAGINAVALSSRPLGAEETASYQAWGAAVLFRILATTTP